MNTPWDGCKVAFGVEDDEPVWRAWEPGKRPRFKLPTGWSLCQTDCSGARCVAVFLVEGRAPNYFDGQAVLMLLQKLGVVARELEPS